MVVDPEPELDPESGLEGLELAAGVGDVVAASTGPDRAKPPATAAAPSTGSASSQRLLMDTDGTSFALTRPIGADLHQPEDGSCQRPMGDL